MRADQLPTDRDPRPAPVPILPAGLTPEQLRGIRCRACGCADLRVSYTAQGRGYKTRIRFCRHCGRRVVTREVEI